MSLPSRGAWIEILDDAVDAVYMMSLPSRGAWIEISSSGRSWSSSSVAPLAGSVDRNQQYNGFVVLTVVAPLAGSVDRNSALTVSVLTRLCRSPHGERG